MRTVCMALLVALSGVSYSETFYKDYHQPIAYDYVGIGYFSEKNETGVKFSGLNLKGSYELMNNVLITGHVVNGEEGSWNKTSLSFGPKVYFTVYPHLDLRLGINFVSNETSFYDEDTDVLTKTESKGYSLNAGLNYQPSKGSLIAYTYDRTSEEDSTIHFGTHIFGAKLKITKKFWLSGTFILATELTDPQEETTTGWSATVEYML